MTAGSNGSEENKQLLRRQYEDVWANGNADVLDKTCSHDVVFYGLPTTDRSADIRAFKDFIGTCSRAFSDLKNDVEDVIAEGDRVVVRSTLSGTHDGDPFLEADASDSEVEVAVTTIFRIERGKIAEAWMCFDTMGLLQQIGAMPEHPQSYDWKEVDE